MSKKKLTAIVAVLALYGGVQQAAAQAMPPPPAPAPKSYASTATAPAVYARHVGPVSVLEVRPDVSMLTVDGYNLAVIHGEDGVVVVDTGPEARANDVLAAIRSVCEAPIRYLVNTGAGKGSSGGNEILAKAGNAFSVGTLGLAAPIIAHQNALQQMLAEPGQNHPAEALPSEIFSRKVRSAHLNGQAIQAVWEPNALTDGDIVVTLRRSDVIITGALLDLTGFPDIDLEHGGSIQGEINALNDILTHMAVGTTPFVEEQEETLIIPGRGPLADKDDLVNYRDMVTIVRDRVQDGIGRRQSISQIMAADPLQGFRNRYSESPEAADRFIRSVYDSLRKQPKLLEGGK